MVTAYPDLPRVIVFLLVLPTQGLTQASFRALSGRQVRRVTSPRGATFATCSFYFVIIALVERWRLREWERVPPPRNSQQ